MNSTPASTRPSTAPTGDSRHSHDSHDSHNGRVTPPAAFPPEYIPKQPVLSLATFAQRSDAKIPSVLDVGEVRHVNRGCMAIGLALLHAQIGSGDEVLLPAYHCISMVEPVVWRGAQPTFYRVHADTSIDLSDIETKITLRTRALLVTHYFGFPQDMVRIRAFCDAHRLVLIEDCAHAFFGAIGGMPIGSFGDYAIASTWKFFPVHDGGLLISARRDLAGINLKAPGVRFQAKALINALEQAFEYRRFPILRFLLKVPLWLKDSALRLAKQGKKPATTPVASADANPAAGVGNWGFDPLLINQSTSAFSRLVANRASKYRIAQQRRSNYARLLAEFDRVSGCRPLFPILPDGVIPQVFPLLIDEPERIFSRLRGKGVPIIRFGEFPWPDMSTTLCTVSTDLSRRVFQFPCHQDLLPTELDWMIDSIHEALRAYQATTDSTPAQATVRQ